MPVGRPPLAEAARTAGWMTLLGAPVMAVLFVLFPRLAPLWGMPSDAMAGRTGLSTRMEVGVVANLAMDDSVALRVKFLDPPPPQRELYFRGPVLGEFDGRVWQPLFARLGPHFPPPQFGNPHLTGTGARVRYIVTLEPTNQPWLLPLDAPAAPPRVPGVEVAMSSELLWVASRPLVDLMRYEAESYVSFRHGPQSRSMVLPEYWQLPAGFNPRTMELAARLMREHPRDPPAQVQAALRLLRTGGYTYTFEPGTYGEHTADEFWFDRKEGFCEHIASAFAVLMRGMGIPARIVTGYQGGEFNRLDGYLVVRHSDAHAWTEVFLDKRGWVRVDPTAAVAPGRTGSLQRLAPPRGAFAAAIDTMDPKLSALMRTSWEALNNGWNQWILNYTQSRQLNMLKRLGFDSPGWTDLARLLIAVIVAAATLGAGWSWWDRRQHDPWLRLLGRARRRLRQAGVEVGRAAPPRQIANLVTTRFGPDARPLADWLLKLEAQRYARAGSASLTALRREFHHLAWPR
jgi:transglutaminase-like putative cysteine protease